MYAKLFIESWNKKNPGWNFYGIGDREMAEAGMDCQGFAEDLAVVGIQEVIAHYPEIKQTANKILEKSKKNKPKFALLLDYPGFNLRLAPKLKAMGIPVVYYISPQLWAWKKGRVHQIRKNVDDMLVVFPFEVDFYKDYDIEANFVGHPLVEVVENELAQTQASTSTGKSLGLMPGSRKSEIKHNLQTQLAAAEKLRGLHPDLKIKLLLAPTLDKEWVKSQFTKPYEYVELVQDKPTAMIMGCDYILSASGTATLQVALCKKPMVVMYRMNSITAFFAKLLVNTVKFFCIVNLIAGREVVRERFQEQASPQNLADDLNKLIVETEKREQMIADFESIIEKLGSGGATSNVVDFLDQRYLQV